MAQAATKPYSAKRYALDYAPLKRAVKGRVADDDLTRALYASSASIVEVWPSCVVEPKDAADVLAVVNFARDKGVPITARGAGSGVAGQSLGQGIILDFSVHMNALLEINPQQGFARVQPGVVKDDFDAELKTYGMFWPPDPSSSPWCTVGAMIANNSGGARSIRYGTTKDYLLELDVLTIEGELDDISGSGQTQSAHSLCTGIPAAKQKHFEAPGVGHYGIFSGRRWRKVIYPQVQDFIAHHNTTATAVRKPTRKKASR